MINQMRYCSLETFKQNFIVFTNIEHIPHKLWYHSQRTTLGVEKHLLLKMDLMLWMRMVPIGLYDWILGPLITDMIWEGLEGVVLLKRYVTGMGASFEVSKDTSHFQCSSVACSLRCELSVTALALCHLMPQLYHHEP